MVFAAAVASRLLSTQAAVGSITVLLLLGGRRRRRRRQHRRGIGRRPQSTGPLEILPFSRLFPLRDLCYTVVVILFSRLAQLLRPIPDGLDL